jgi:glycosyltransferase involved in cell wall biosynthesis
MESLSVLVTACNNAAVLPAALHSVEAALNELRAAGGNLAAMPVEIVLVDDGSTDDTPGVLARETAGKDYYRILRRPRPTSPSCARNIAAEAATGSLLFFLDADDLYLSDHLRVCCELLADPTVNFVKTSVRLADPVHPDWRERIENSVVINLAIRRACHMAAGGFPDYHLFIRKGDEFHHVRDLFYKLEDQYYNAIVIALFRGARVKRETVQYLRHPGNAYDRQYEKFCHPLGEYREQKAQADIDRLRVCELVAQEQLRQALAARKPGQSLSGSAS